MRVSRDSQARRLRAAVTCSAYWDAAVDDGPLPPMTSAQAADVIWSYTYSHNEPLLRRGAAARRPGPQPREPHPGPARARAQAHVTEDVPAVFTFDVGFTTTRPVIPDEHVSRVQVAAHSEAEATTLAALMVCRGERLVEEEPVPNRPRRAGSWWPAVQMPTSTTLVAVEW